MSQLQVPQGSGDGNAQLEVQPQGGDGASSFGFVLNADLTPWLAQGAWHCQFVTQVIDRQTQEVVGSWHLFGEKGGSRSCAEKSRMQGILWQENWNGRRSDGRDAPAGIYEVLAGLKVTLRSGRIIWVLAPPQMISIP